MSERLQLREGWLTVILPWLMVLTTAASIHSAELVRSYDMIPILFVLGTAAFVAGVALARSVFPYYTAHIYAFVYGLFLYGIVMGNLLPDADLMTWRERISELIQIQVQWLATAFDGGSNREPFVFVMHTSAIFWLLGYTAAWYTVRRLRIWRVILPSGLVLLSVVYYYFGPRPIYLYLALYVVLALLYVTQTFLSTRRQQWQATAVRYERGIGWTFVRSSLLIGSLALLIAWWLPAAGSSTTVESAISRVNEPWRQFRDGWQRLVATNATGQTVSDPYRDSIVLGGPRSAGDEPMMDVYVSEQLPYAYWRETVLDRYEGDAWKVAPGQTITYYPDDGRFALPESELREPVTQQFVNYRSNAGAIYSLPDMISTDRQMYARLTLDQQGKQNVTAARARYALQLNDRYQVVSQLSVADATSLRTASTAYPQAIRDQYLPLPDTITDRTLGLAAELTASHDNPYDKAIAVQDWLRNNMEYNDQIAVPPRDRELVDYFLFESQEGYCNYYASAMAVMLRSQGIPTRLARGFASGEYQEEGGFYRVRARDAHTWVEVYFSQYGWIQFEPTAIIEPVTRPEGEGVGGESGLESAEPVGDSRLDDLEERLEPETPPGPENVDPFGDGAVQESSGGFLAEGVTLPFVAGVAVLLLAGIAVLLAQRYNRGVESNVERSYARLLNWSKWVGADIRPNHTPYEGAKALATSVPDGEQSIRALVGAYVHRQFSRRQDTFMLRNPRDQWKALRPAMLKQSIRHLPRRLRRKKSAES